MTSRLIDSKILVLSQYEFPLERRNQNMYQRLFYGSRYADICLLLPRGAHSSDELRGLIEVRNAPFRNRFLYFLYLLGFAAVRRFRGYRLVFTDGSVFAAFGFALKYLLGYFWMFDVWDRPRWRPGQHQPGDRVPLSSRILFRMMGRADLFVLSVLPGAASDVRMDPARVAQFYNCINLAECADSPPVRDTADPTLHVGFGRARFDHTIGVGTVVRAAEELRKGGYPVVFHVVGKLTPELQAQIEGSGAADMFRIHGFIKSSRREFYSRMHVGLCPYDPYTDNSFIFPIKVLEHLSQGNPVVASRLPGLCAMVEDGVNGLVFEPGDGADLARALARLQQDRELWQRLADNALASIRRFDVEKKNEGIFQAVAAHFGRWQRGR